MLRDAGPLFERVLRELGVSELPATEARQVVAAGIARRIVAGAVRLRDGLSNIKTLCEASGERDFELSRWVLYDDGWPEAPQENAARHAETDKQVHEAARALLVRLPPEARGGP